MRGIELASKFDAIYFKRVRGAKHSLYNQDGKHHAGPKGQTTLNGELTAELRVLGSTTEPLR